MLGETDMLGVVLPLEVIEGVTVAKTEAVPTTLADTDVDGDALDETLGLRETDELVEVDTLAEAGVLALAEVLDVSE